MPIIVNLDVMLAKRKMSMTELSEQVGVTMANLSILKNGHAKAVRFSTMAKRSPSNMQSSTVASNVCR